METLSALLSLLQWSPAFIVDISLSELLNKQVTGDLRRSCDDTVMAHRR